MKIDSQEYAQMQRDRINKTKPWLKTKGPKTPKGKARSKMNALKIDPELHRMIKEYKYLIRQQNAIQKMANLQFSVTFS